MTEYTDRDRWQRHKRQEQFEEKVLRKLDHVERQLRNLMTTVEEVTQALETLKVDLESKAAEAKAEFEKLEQEVSEGHTEPNLTPLKEAIDGIDTAVKASEVPTT